MRSLISDDRIVPFAFSNYSLASSNSYFCLLVNLFIYMSVLPACKFAHQKRTLDLIALQL